MNKSFKDILRITFGVIAGAVCAIGAIFIIVTAALWPVIIFLLVIIGTCWSIKHFFL